MVEFIPLESHTGVVDEHVHLLEALLEFFQEAVNTGAVANVQLNGVEPVLGNLD